MAVLRRINEVLERAAVAVIALMMAIMCLVIFAQVVGRYSVKFSLPWSEELSRFLMVWIAMLGGAVAARRRMHVGFEALVEALPSGLRTGVQGFTVLVAMGIFGYLAWYGLVLARFNMMQVSAAMQIPMGIPYSAVPTGASMVVLFLAEELWLILSGQTRAHGHLDDRFGSA